MYRSGDLARWLPDGNLEFLGRDDDQLKIRGFRVEPAEIETALRSHSAVRESVVLARADGRGERRLIAYVVANGSVDQDALRRHLGEWVPEFMVPSAIVLLDDLPRTPSGKVDRRALPAPEEVDSGQSATYVAPRSSIEEKVAAIWIEVLGLERVSVQEDFFALGGHSLLATQVIARVRGDFAVDLPLHALFTAPTVETLSQAIVEVLGDDEAETEQLLTELEALSDEDAERLLAGGTSDEGPS
jgi:acyl carrier protein